MFTEPEGQPCHLREIVRLGLALAALDDIEQLPASAHFFSVDTDVEHLLADEVIDQPRCVGEVREWNGGNLAPLHEGVYVAEQVACLETAVGASRDASAAVGLVESCSR